MIVAYQETSRSRVGQRKNVHELMAEKMIKL